MLSGMTMPSLLNPAKFPPSALVSEIDTTSKDFPEPALTSKPSFNRSCALARSPVPRTRFSNAGRSSLSFTPVANCCVVINFSVAAMAWSVAPVTFCKVFASFN